LRAPEDDVITVEVLELNQVFTWRTDDERSDPQKRVSLSQWIIWEQYRPRDETDTGWHVWCWRRRQDIEVVTRDRGHWKLHYRGRPIVARIFRETWTEYDPEIIDARDFPKSFRRQHIEGWQH
jgi:hypothetical protein